MGRWSIEENLRIVNETYGMLEKFGVNIVNLTKEEKEKYFEVLSRHATGEWLDNAINMGVSDEAVII